MINSALLHQIAHVDHTDLDVGYWYGGHPSTEGHFEHLYSPIAVENKSENRINTT